MDLQKDQGQNPPGPPPNGSEPNHLDLHKGQQQNQAGPLNGDELKTPAGPPNEEGLNPLGNSKISWTTRTTKRITKVSSWLNPPDVLQITLLGPSGPSGPPDQGHLDLLVLQVLHLVLQVLLVQGHRVLPSGPPGPRSGPSWSFSWRCRTIKTCSSSCSSHSFFWSCTVC